MVHRLRSNNKNRSNRKEPTRSSRHLKMVGKVIRLEAPLRPPITDGDNKGTADADNIVRKTKTIFPSPSDHHNHRRRRMTTPATTKVPNDKGILPPALKNDNMTTTKTRQRYTNNTGSRNGKRGVLPPPKPPKATGKIEKNSLPVGRHTHPQITTAASANEIIKKYLLQPSSQSAPPRPRSTILLHFNDDYKK